MADFPHSRFARVAAEAEVEQLAAEWARSDIYAQSSLAASWASMDDAGLRQQVSDLRDAGHFAAAGPDGDNQGDIPEDENAPDAASQAESDGDTPGDANDPNLDEPEPEPDDSAPVEPDEGG